MGKHGNRYFDFKKEPTHPCCSSTGGQGNGVLGRYRTCVRGSYNLAGRYALFTDPRLVQGGKFSTCHNAFIGSDTVECKRLVDGGSSIRGKPRRRVRGRSKVLGPP
jgi:hypothetical protein